MLDLPNWAYSYALALHRQSHRNSLSDELKERSNTAMQTALSRFPSVLELLLGENEVDIKGRSCQVDWPSVLDFVKDRTTMLLNSWPTSASNDVIMRSCTQQAYDLIVRIFVQQNGKLWGEDGVFRWVYENLCEIKEDESLEPIVALSPALVRYLQSDPSDYESKFQTLPPEANPLDPGLVAHALAMDPNRRRFMQRMPHEREDADFAAQTEARVIAGPPTQTIDPDWPVLELFWRSALPWNHVEGLPPPRR